MCAHLTKLPDHSIRKLILQGGQQSQLIQVSFSVVIRYSYTIYCIIAARFSPDDKFSRHRVTLKKRFGLLLTQQPRLPM